MPFRLTHKRSLFLFTLCFLVGMFICCIPFNLLLNQGALVRKLHMAGSWSVVLFVLAHIVATAIGIPGTILVLAGGAVFGLVWGTVWSVLGATLGAIAAFILARYFFRASIDRRFGHHPALKKLNAMIHGNSLSCILAVRFAPISPFNIVNFLFGMTPIPLKSYALGTFIGIIPGTAAYTWVGVSGMRALQGQGTTQLILSVSLLALLSILPIALKYISRSIA